MSQNWIIKNPKNPPISQKIQCLQKNNFFWPKKAAAESNKFQIQEVKLTVKFTSLCSKAKGRAAQATYVAT